MWTSFSCNYSVKFVHTTPQNIPLIVAIKIKQNCENNLTIICLLRVRWKREDVPKILIFLGLRCFSTYKQKKGNCMSYIKHIVKYVDIINIHAKFKSCFNISSIFVSACSKPLKLTSNQEFQAFKINRIPFFFISSLYKTGTRKKTENF